MCVCGRTLVSRVWRGWMSPSADFGRRFIIDSDILLLISLLLIVIAEVIMIGGGDQ